MTILNQIEVYERNVLLTLIFFAGIIVSFVLLWISVDRDWHSIWNTIIAVFMAVCFVGTLVFGCTDLFKLKTDRMQYECTIDDSVSFVEIVNKYDIVEQRGDIWVLEDKKDD